MSDPLTSPVLSIALVDDHPLTRYALHSLIADRMRGCRCLEFNTPSQLLTALADWVPDIVIVDLHYAEESGLALIEHLAKENPDIRTLVYSAYSEREYAQKCFSLGACGYICKEDPVTEVQEAIHCVNRGYVYISRSLNEFVIDEAAARSSATEVMHTDDQT